MRGRVPFARRNLLHRKARAAIALAAVCFSVLFMFMEMGFYNSILYSATALYQSLDADVFLISAKYLYIGQTGVIPRQRLYEARQTAGVREAIPLYIGRAMWRNPKTRLRHVILVFGIDPAQPTAPFTDQSRLLDTGQILLDSLTRPQFGPLDTGVETEIGSLQVRIAGQYRVGPGFAADGAAAMSDETFVRIFPDRSIGDINMGLIRLNPKADSRLAVEALRHALPPDTRVLTRAEFLNVESGYWADETSLGPVFGSGLVLGFVVGMVILYQVMFTDIANHMREYATMKALGFTFPQLVRVVLKEVSVFGLIGFILGWLPSFLLYSVVNTYTGLPVTMSLMGSALIFLLTMSMCWASGFLAARKLRDADPAELF